MFHVKHRKVGSMKKNSKLWYNVEDDIKRYPKAWAYLIIGGRRTGKTYSALKLDLITEPKKFAFCKRTADDVDLLCSGDTDNKIDVSPFKTINKDFLCDYRPEKIYNGLAGLYRYNNDEKSDAETQAYILGMSVISKYKGSDFSDAEHMIFDEFIPNVYDRVSRKEGEMILDTYYTIDNARELRGRPALKLIALANATMIFNPLFSVLEIVDLVANMQLKGIECIYIEDRGIFIRILKDSEEHKQAVEATSLYQATKNTAWGQMAYSNTFAYDNFELIKTRSLKGFRCLIGFKFKNQTYYVYYRSETGEYYCCKVKQKYNDFYNLNAEHEQARFWSDWRYILYEATINSMMSYDSYVPYDIIFSFKSIFKI